MAKLKIKGVEIVETFAEAFPMVGTRIIITAPTQKWALIAAQTMTGFATSVIACGAEAGIERLVARRGDAGRAARRRRAALRHGHRQAPDGSSATASANAC